jgi:hypothetical protein
MVRRSLNDWRKIIGEQQSSGLSAAAFCRDKGINAKYFYLRKQKINAVEKDEPAFIKASVKPNLVAGPSRCFDGFELRLNDASSEWTAKLLRELSS